MAQGFTNEQPLDTDGTLSANSDYIAPSEKAVRTYIGINSVPYTGANANVDLGTHSLTAGDVVESLVNQVDISIPDNYCMLVSGVYEISVGTVVDIGNNGLLDIL
jgi:hypothetical protein